MNRNLQVILLGVALVASGCFAVWTGFMTPPGEPAFQIPNRPDWSATEAKVIGSIFVVLGMYAVVVLGRRRQ